MATQYKSGEAAQLVPLESFQSDPGAQSNMTDPSYVKGGTWKPVIIGTLSPVMTTQLKPPKKHHKKWVVEMREAMETDRAKELYKKRKTTVEPVFGIIKGVLGFRAPCALWRS